MWAVMNADYALARLVAAGASSATLDSARRELTALEPSVPDLNRAIRFEAAGFGSLWANLLRVPLVVEVFLLALKERFAPWTWRQSIGVVALPPSAHAEAALRQSERTVAAALQALAGAKRDPQLEMTENGSSAGWSVCLESVFPARFAPLRSLQAAAHAALLRATIDLATVRELRGHLPATPELPRDPFAPGQPLGYEPLPDGRYRLSSVGDGQDPADRWVIVAWP